jgi:ABC-type amino acid transport system permease subunit
VNEPDARPAPSMLRGAAIGAAIVLVAGLAQQLVRGTPLVWLLLGVIFVGLGVAGAVGSVDSRTPLTTGALAALLAFAAAQLVVLTAVLAQGRSPSWTALAFGAMLSTSCGMVGVGVRLRLAGRNRPADPGRQKGEAA